MYNTYIILVETSHGGNIGSAARAMKTMGLTQLRLVAPKSIDEQSIALAAGAEDVVRQAQIFSSLEEAIADCTLIIGTSARLRQLQSTLISPRECGKKIARYKQGNVAIVFGRERIGLTNEELLKCHFHLNIPANDEYSSLNLAMAVQIVTYELWIATLDTGYRETKISQKNEPTYPTAQEMDYFLTHTEQLYQTLGFIQNQGVMQKLRRFYNRVKLEKQELNILQGMLSAVEKRFKSDNIQN